MQTQIMDHTKAYRILGLNKSSSQADIKKAYKTMAKKHHPDKGGKVEHFHSIKEAFDVLANGTSPSLDNIFDTLFKGAKPFTQARMKVKLPEIHVTLQEAYYGADIKTSIKGEIPCSTCSGLGRAGDECPHCKGRGCSSHVRRPHFTSNDICGYCSGTGFSSRCTTCNGKGTIRTDIEIQLLLHPFTVDRTIRNNESTSLHRRVLVIVDVPEDYRQLSNGQVIYRPKVELIDVIQGYTLDVLGHRWTVEPFSFTNIQVETGLLVIPDVQVADRTIFEKLVK